MLKKTLLFGLLLCGLARAQQNYIAIDPVDSSSDPYAIPFVEVRGDATPLGLGLTGRDGAITLRGTASLFTSTAISPTDETGLIIATYAVDPVLQTITAVTGYLQLSPGPQFLPNTNDPSIAAYGTASNINIDVVPKGSGRLQVSGVNVPSISSTDTLTNKTLTSPTISGGTITGITDLVVADGGTGVSTLAAHGVLVGNGTSAVAVTGAGTAGQVLTSNGASADPTFQAAGGGLGHAVTVYAAGTTYALTTTPALLDFGTTDPSLVIDQAGTYLIQGRCHVQLSAASTPTTNRTITVKLRRTNNTAADLTNGTVTCVAKISIAAVTETLSDMAWSVIYTTTNTDDILQLFGSIDTTPTAGSIVTQEAAIVAVRIQ